MKGKTLISILILVGAVVLLVLALRNNSQTSSNPSNQVTMPDENFDINNIDQLMMVSLQEGEGNSIQNGQTAVVHYVGTLTDGVVFDSSLTREEPFEFQLGAGSVIEGWEVGVRDMRVGEVRRLIVPPTMGYGANQVGPIPPNSVLIFDIELLEIK
jgi:peptidylprolyl isomerase